MWIAAPILTVLFVGQVSTTAPAVVSKGMPTIIEDAPAVSRNAVCPYCQVRTQAILDRIVLLQKSPRGESRERAAHDLRKVRWQCHPEVVGALTFSLLKDPDTEVREEAAESLSRMRPNDPSAYQALGLAANNDPDRATRRAARTGLNAWNFNATVRRPAIVPAPEFRVFGPNGALATARRLATLPVRMVQQRVVLPAGVLPRPIVVPGVTIESVDAPAPVEILPDSVIEPSDGLNGLPPEAQPDAPFSAKPNTPENEPKLEPVDPDAKSDSKVGPSTDLAPLDDSEPEKVPAPPEPGPVPPADQILKPLTEKSDSATTTKGSKTKTARRKVASYYGSQVPLYIPR